MSREARDAYAGRRGAHLVVWWVGQAGGARWAGKLNDVKPPTRFPALQPPVITVHRLDSENCRVRLASPPAGHQEEWADQHEPSFLDSLSGEHHITARKSATRTIIQRKSRGVQWCMLAFHGICSGFMSWLMTLARKTVSCCGIATRPMSTCSGAYERPGIGQRC